jgi:hypothetical protein
MGFMRATDNYRMILLNHLKTVTFTRETSSEANSMAREKSSMSTNQSTKVNGDEASTMALEN